MTHDEVRDMLRPIIAERGQSVVAREAGISQPTISYWLACRNRMDDAVLRRVAEACGLRLSYTLRRARGRGGVRAVPSDPAPR